jgi:DNA-binding response OmpR family regulator
MDDPPRILVVNDDEDAGALVERVLTHAGFEVDRVTTTDDAVAHATGAPPALVVLDLSSGVGGSLKLLETLRTHADPDLAAAGAVLISRQAGNRVFAWQSGIDALLVRPFHADELLREVTAVIRRTPDERARHRQEQQARADGS